METKFKIVETENYLIATSTKDFETNYYYNEFDKALRIGTVRQLYHKSVVGYYSKDGSLKLDLPLLPMLPEIVVEDNVEKLFNKSWMSRYSKFDSDIGKSFELGHESATKKYSEEDMRNAIELSRVTYQDKSFGKTMFKYKPGEVIQLTKESKTPKWFVAEMEQVILKDPNSCEHYIAVGCIENTCTCYTFRLKTTTINNKTYLVGHYE
jgi:hypothetical protein